MTGAIRRIVFFLAASLFLLALVGPPSLLAQRTGGGGSREEQERRREELLKSAKESHALGVLLMQAASVVLGLMLFYAAYSTLTKGLKISKTKQMEGGGAKVLAAILLLAGIALIALGILYAPTLGP